MFDLLASPHAALPFLALGGQIATLAAGIGAGAIVGIAATAGLQRRRSRRGQTRDAAWKAALRASEADAQAILQAFPSVAFLIDRDDRVLATNAHLAARIGMPGADIVGRSVWDFVPENVAEIRRQKGREALATKLPVVFTDERDGRIIDTNLVPVIDERGEATRLAVFAQDVTDSQRAQVALQESEGLLKEAQALAHLGHWILDLQGDVLTWSAEIYRIFEIDPDRFGATYEAFLNAIHPDDRDMVNEAYTASVANRTSYSIQHRLLMPNGLVKYVQERGQTTYAEDGGPLRSIGTVQDITQVRLAEEALRQNEELFRNVFEHASIGICYNALAGHFLRVNDKFAEITGYPADELIGMDFQAITHPDDLDRDRSDLRALLAGTIPSYSREGRYIRKDGSDAWANLTVALSRDHAGNPGFFVCTMEEITARKRAEQQTLAALQEKETLLKEVHHRVKNNLAVVVELLNMQANRELDPASRSALLESETRIHAMALVHEMIYRSETLAEIDLREHVERLCHQLMETYGRTGAQVHLRMEIDGAGLVLDQAVPFSLLLNELISNALKHAFPEGRSGDIHVRVSTAADGYTTLEVQDDGVGLAPSFNPQKSSSLGLRLVYSLARQLGASVEVIRGSGTAFKFVFKAKHAKVEAA